MYLCLHSKFHTSGGIISFEFSIISNRFDKITDSGKFYSIYLQIPLEEWINLNEACIDKLPYVKLNAPAYVSNPSCSGSEAFPKNGNWIESHRLQAKFAWGTE